MSLNLESLENVTQFENKLTARCPACAEAGADDKGDHLAIFADGSFACIMFPGEDGHPHRQQIYQLAGLPDGSGKPASATPMAQAAPEQAKRILRLPALRKLTMDEMAAIAQLRKWPVSIMAPGLISHRELLWYGMVWDDGQEYPAWLVTDSARLNAQARRLDGQLWQSMGAKAKSLPGSKAPFPIGTPEIGNRPLVILCEGQPDFCAALLVALIEARQMTPGNFVQVVDQIAPVCMTGSSLSIHPDALVYFEDKHVRIAVHNDPAGREGATRWSEQLYWAGALSVDWIDFAGLKLPDGQPVKDLADYATQLTLENPRPPLMLRELPAWLVAALKIPDLTQAHPSSSQTAR